MSVFIPNTATTYLSTPWTPSATQDMTLMCWGRLSTTNPGTYRNFLSALPNMSLQTWSDGFTFDTGTNTADHTGSILAPNVWYHLTYTVSNAGTTNNHHIRGYLNGSLNVDVVDTGTFSTFTAIQVGNFSTFSLPLSGNVRDVRIWTRALASTEVLREMSTPQPVAPGLLLWSPLDADARTDQSGNGHQWTTNGAGILLQSGFIMPYPKRSLF